MKRIKTALLSVSLTLLALPATMSAAEALAVQSTTADAGEVCGLEISDISLSRSGSAMNVKMNMNLGDLRVKRNQAAIYIPVLVNGEDSLELNPVGVYGAARYMQYIRKANTAIWGPKETSFKYSKRPEVYSFNQTVTYQDWMNGAQLKINRRDFGCCNKLIDLCDAPVSGWSEISYTPECVFQTAQTVTVKTREITGRAYVDFPVNQTVIYPDYRRNEIELGTIIATIDSVKNDPDITIDALSIKGFASPEGPYDNNVRLAKGRTEALKTYVQQLYKFPEGFIQTSYEPEDWEGLRQWVEASNIDNKEGILAIIDSDLAPDPKNTKIQTTYPVQYKFLLDNVYPALRHSDYRIQYTIRQFVDVAEIAEVIKRAPQKLSLNEMYLLADSLEPGSPEYNEVYEIAVRMYPMDETANLNAANVAMQRGNMEDAGKYLAKAGNSPEAIYARGIFAANNGDYETAMEYFRAAAPSLPKAAEALRVLEQVLGGNED